jgi:hypothetical protein
MSLFVVQQSGGLLAAHYPTRSAIHADRNPDILEPIPAVLVRMGGKSNVDVERRIREGVPPSNAGLLHGGKVLPGKLQRLSPGVSGDMLQDFLIRCHDDSSISKCAVFALTVSSAI